MTLTLHKTTSDGEILPPVPFQIRKCVDCGRHHTEHYMVKVILPHRQLRLRGWVCIGCMLARKVRSVGEQTSLPLDAPDEL